MIYGPEGHIVDDQVDDGDPERLYHNAGNRKANAARHIATTVGKGLIQAGDALHSVGRTVRNTSKAVHERALEFVDELDRAVGRQYDTAHGIC